MKKLVILLLLLGGVSSVSASIDWLTSATSDNWFTAANWSNGVPSSTQSSSYNVRTFQTHMNTTYMPRIDINQPGYVAASAYSVEVGGDNDAVSPTKSRGRLIINSGSLTTADYIRCGASSTSNRWGQIYINGGTVNAGGPFTVGWGSTTLDVEGWLYMTGGTVNVPTNAFNIAYAVGASGRAYLSGNAIINCKSFAMDVASGTHTGTTLLDMKNNAKVIITGDVRTLVQTYIDNGWITGNVLYDYNVSNAGKTTLYVPEPVTVCLLSLGAFTLLRRKK